MSYQNFRDNLKNWVKLDEKQIHYQKKLGKIRNKKSEIKPDLVSYMRTSNIKELPINSNFKLNCKETCQYNFINKDHLTKVISKYIGNTSQVKMIVDDIYKSREKRHNYDISITKKQ